MSSEIFGAGLTPATRRMLDLALDDGMSTGDIAGIMGPLAGVIAELRTTTGQLGARVGDNALAARLVSSVIEETLGVSGAGAGSSAEVRQLEENLGKLVERGRREGRDIYAFMSSGDPSSLILTAERTRGDQHHITIRHGEQGGLDISFSQSAGHHQNESLERWSVPDSAKAAVARVLSSCRAAFPNGWSKIEQFAANL